MQQRTTDKAENNNDTDHTARRGIGGQWSGVLARGLDIAWDFAVRRWLSPAPAAHDDAEVIRAAAAAAPTTRVLVDKLGADSGASDAGSQDWASVNYGKYYATSSTVHSAVKVLAEAVARPKLAAWQRSTPDADLEPAHHSHPMQTLLDQPNSMWTAGEFWRAVESWLALTGSAFVQIQLDDNLVPVEMWPLRSDEVRVLLSEDNRSVTGFVHESADGSIAILRNEMLWFRRFNPIQPYAGLSSIAPTRAAVDMSGEAMRFNRSFFKNAATPSDLVVKVSNSHPSAQEIERFLERWQERFSTPEKAHSPVVLGEGLEMKHVGLNHRDMEFVAALSWSVEEVSRAFGVPKVFLSEFEDATLANVRTMEQFLWRNTIIPELRLFEDVMNRRLAPHFNEFPGQLEVRFDLTQIEAIQESQSDRAARLTNLVASGVITVQEARRDLGLAA